MAQHQSFEKSFEKQDRRGPHMVRHIIYGQTQYPHSRPIRYIESELTSNLGLQKLLYYNLYYSYSYFYIMMCTEIFKLWILEIEIFTLLRFIFIILWGVLEIFRLLNGFEGNIKEQFPELFSFFLLSMMNFALQIVTVIFPRSFPIEYAVVIIQCVFYGFEMILALVEMINVNRAKVALLGQRAPPNNREYLMRKQIEHMKFEQQLDVKNRKKEITRVDETAEEEEEDNYQYNRLG